MPEYIKKFTYGLLRPIWPYLDQLKEYFKVISRVVCIISVLVVFAITSICIGFTVFLMIIAALTFAVNVNIFETILKTFKKGINVCVLN